MSAVLALAATGVSAHAATSPFLGYASLGLVVAVTFGGVWVLVHTARHPGAGEDDDSDRDGGPGGGGPGMPSPPTLRPDGDPDWWPEFERAFAAHVASQVMHSE